ncbi:probable cytochrome P450 9f2 [Sitodiplosis mosellana]|uniref:probable cytochrome P450 9f2 n=1 Tax=Sitodiplosis mosellana TaxID=263140 RepID=UPI002443E17F|nr:probable cytochrome P450 9f2 [Sitodiplosis mosellana]
MLAELLFYAIISGTLFYIFYKWATINREYFVKRKLKHVEPNFLIGNLLGLFLKRHRPAEFMDSLYYRYPNEKLIGLFDMRVPIYLVRDVDLIQKITKKDFDNFEDHVAFIDSESDTLFGQSLFLMSEQKWREMRATLSPAFTGSKMRHMFELVVECADDMAKYLVSEAKQKPVRWEMKELFSRYTSDVIASCAFGLKVDSLKDRTNEFFTIGTNSLNFGSFAVAMRMLLIRSMPKLMRAIDFEFFPAHVKHFFKSMVLDTMAEREKKHIVRADMINILMQVRSGNLKHQVEEAHDDDAGFATVKESNIGKGPVKRSWTDDEIVAQCFIFFAAGFDTVSTLMSFLSYELAINQDVQKTLYEEIREVNKTLNGTRLTYDTLSKMKYLDQVISEALRKWPPAIFTTRKCTKDYDLDLDGNKVLIERGNVVFLPICSIHHDSKFYENPEHFDPERFNDENKHKINPGAYLPFGIGPRNCIGSRFALMEVKALFFYLVLNFNIQPYEKTQIPVQIAKSAANWITERGIHVEFKPRV